jgi:CubicO group peptidase (beta-lactamase class C family)
LLIFAKRLDYRMDPRRLGKLLIMISLFPLLSACHAGRYISWNTADIRDHQRFPFYTINKAGHAFYFDKPVTEQEPLLPSAIDIKGKYGNFESFLAAHHTLAFLIIRNDTILYERYFGGTDTATILPGFSVAKSFVSALTGIAVGEGLIRDVNQPVTDYLDGFRDPAFNNISIQNLLNMRSGIRFSETYYNPFGHAARFYYGRNLKRYVMNLKVNDSQDAKYHYNSANSQILAMIIEKASGKKFTEYFGEKLWSLIGTEYGATWNYDSEKYGMVKAFCCLNATARDFAKFGRLYLHGGNWEGERIIPADWVKHSMNIHNDSRDSQDYPYTYYWRVLENGDVFAKGILGQYIYIIPSQNTIIVRLGKKYAGIHWSALFREIAGQY